MRVVYRHVQHAAHYEGGGGHWLPGDPLPGKVQP